jgi:hypothetical protein
MWSDVEGAQFGHMIGRVIGLVASGRDAAPDHSGLGFKHHLRSAALGGTGGQRDHAGHRQPVPVLYAGVAHWPWKLAPPSPSLRAADFLPEVWLPEADTERLRRLVARRNQVVRNRTWIKNEVHSILHAHLIPKCLHAELFGRLGHAIGRLLR